MKRIRISRLKRFHGLLTIALGSTIALFAAWLFTFFLFLIKGKPMPSIYGLPVDIIMRNNRVLTDNSTQIYVGDLKGSILLFNPSNLIAIYSCLYTVFIWLSLSYIIYLMRKIIGTIIIGNPFVLQNRTRLRIIGGIFAAGPALLHFISQWFVSHLIPLIKIENVSLSSSNSSDLVWMGILAGILFVSLSEIFITGTQLKEENELTV